MDKPLTLFIGVAVLGLVNSTIGRIAKMVTLPLACLTFGLAWVLINALLFWWVGTFGLGFKVGDFGAALVGSVLMSVVGGALRGLAAPERGRGDFQAQNQALAFEWWTLAARRLDRVAGRCTARSRLQPQPPGNCRAGRGDDPDLVRSHPFALVRGAGPRKHSTLRRGRVPHARRLGGGNWVQAVPGRSDSDAQSCSSRADDGAHCAEAAVDGGPFCRRHWWRHRSLNPFAR
ncbi:MAG: hypothetical protein C4340_06430, partial [Armatimonadota bacterium]